MCEIRRDDRGFKYGDTVILVNTATKEEARFRIGHPTQFTDADLLDMWDLACIKKHPAPLVIFDLYDPDTWDEMGMDDAAPHSV